MSKIEPPYYPIVYVRGFAGTQAEVEDTVATPYMGFNLGATKIRQAWTGAIERHYFESPLIRLMKDFDYRDFYQSGAELPDSARVSPRSLIIYRYYDQVSQALGVGQRPEIEDYARGLARLILDVARRLRRDAENPQALRVNLVAHSMGGLICRCMLQNPALAGDELTADGLDEARRLVDKVFTYATPHNGIDATVVGNVPGFFTQNNLDNFNRRRMREYLGLPAAAGDDVSSLGDRFDANRMFCLVGTNHRDYEAAGGLARRVVGPMSDGLVRIANATTWGSGTGARSVTSPRAFVHRSHSGDYGIVNSEEGYQNLTRFLFGNVRVDGQLVIHRLTLPPKLQRVLDRQREEVKRGERASTGLRASYHFETVVRVRGSRWDLHRRLVAEQSAVFMTYEQLVPTGEGHAQQPYLFSVFLSADQRVNRRRSGLGFSVDLSVHVPEYTVDGTWWRDQHYDGGFLFRDKLNLDVATPRRAQDPWRLRYGFDSQTPNRVGSRTASAQTQDGGIRFEIPINQRTDPGIQATLVLAARAWS